MFGDAPTRQVLRDLTQPVDRRRPVRAGGDERVGDGAIGVVAAVPNAGTVEAAFARDDVLGVGQRESIGLWPIFGWLRQRASAWSPSVGP